MTAQPEHHQCRKIGHKTFTQAEAARKRVKHGYREKKRFLNVYRCRYCGLFHVGNKGKIVEVER